MIEKDKQTAKEKIIVFDDGSIEFQVLEKQLSFESDKVTIEKIKAKSFKEFIEKIPDKNTEKIQKIYLHYSLEKCCSDSIQDKIYSIRANYPNLRLALRFENHNESRIHGMAKGYGLENNNKDKK